MTAAAASAAAAPPKHRRWVRTSCPLSSLWVSKRIEKRIAHLSIILLWWWLLVSITIFSATPDNYYDDRFLDAFLITHPIFHLAHSKVNAQWMEQSRITRFYVLAIVVCVCVTWLDFISKCKTNPHTHTCSHWALVLRFRTGVLDICVWMFSVSLSHCCCCCCLTSSSITEIIWLSLSARFLNQNWSIQFSSFELHYRIDLFSSHFLNFWLLLLFFHRVHLIVVSFVRYSY